MCLDVNLRTNTMKDEKKAIEECVVLLSVFREQKKELANDSLVHRIHLI